MKKRKRSITPQELFQKISKNVRDYIVDNAVLLKKYHLESHPVIIFPKKRAMKAPILSRIAMWVINKQGGVMDTQFRSIKK